MVSYSTRNYCRLVFYDLEEIHIKGSKLTKFFDNKIFRISDEKELPFFSFIPFLYQMMFLLQLGLKEMSIFCDKDTVLNFNVLSEWAPSTKGAKPIMRPIFKKKNCFKIKKIGP